MGHSVSLGGTRRGEGVRISAARVASTAWGRYAIAASRTNRDARDEAPQVKKDAAPHPEQVEHRRGRVLARRHGIRAIERRRRVGRGLHPSACFRLRRARGARRPRWRWYGGRRRHGPLRATLLVGRFPFISIYRFHLCASSSYRSRVLVLRRALAEHGTFLTSKSRIPPILHRIFGPSR